MKERVIWIDQLRGFCIFLMLLGHVAVPKPVNNYIYSFHMPLFFIISGMTLNYDRLLEYDFKSYFIKRIKGYIIPYLFLNFTAIPIYWFVKSILQGSELSILRMLFGISMANYLTGFEHPAGPSWFLPTLFLAHMIFYMFVKLSKGDKRFVILFCAVSALIGFTERKTNLPLHLGTAFSGCMFMFIGSVLKPVIELSVRKKIWGGVVLFCMILGSLSHYVNGRISMHANIFGKHFLLYFFTPCCFAYGLSLLFCHLPKIRLLHYAGQNTLLYIGASSLFISIMNRCVIPSDYVSNVFVQISLAVCLFVLYVPLIMFVNKFFPYICGKMKVSKNSFVDLVLKFFILVWSLFVPIYILCNESLIFSIPMTLAISAGFLFVSIRFFPVIWLESRSTDLWI